jgi:phage repressor protein C with HTH and peptisase S24 domain
MFNEGTPKGEFDVPLRGFIAAGQQVTFFEDIGQAEGSTNGLLGGPDTSAFEVRGDSMYPLAKQGDIAFFGPPVRGRDIARLVGRECIATLEDGHRYFKTIEKSSKGQRYYDLRSYNADTIHDVEIHEAGAFVGLRRAT